MFGWQRSHTLAENFFPKAVRRKPREIICVWQLMRCHSPRTLNKRGFKIHYIHETVNWNRISKSSVCLWPRGCVIVFLSFEQDFNCRVCTERKGTFCSCRMRFICYLETWPAVFLDWDFDRLTFDVIGLRLMMLDLVAFCCPCLQGCSVLHHNKV